MNLSSISGDREAYGLSLRPDSISQHNRERYRLRTLALDVPAHLDTMNLEDAVLKDLEELLHSRRALRDERRSAW